MRFSDAMIENPDLTFETELWPHFQYIVGLDEAGRGALAGPVAVGAVILPNSDPHLALTLSGARDSKQMTPPERERLAIKIKETALTWSVGFASADEIDSQGIVRATRLAAIRALHQFTLIPQYLLTDFRLELPQIEIPQTSLVKGDVHCLSIACASILAKTARDTVMRELAEQHPGYGLDQCKGYGTEAHRSALKRLGLSSVHRRSFHIKQVTF